MFLLDLLLRIPLGIYQLTGKDIFLWCCFLILPRIMTIKSEKVQKEDTIFFFSYDLREMLVSQAKAFIYEGFKCLLMNRLSVDAFL